MLFVTLQRGHMATTGKRSIASLWRLIRHAGGRLSWGVADQAMSSVSNFAVNIYIARTLGAVQYGAFALAYVTYGFVLNASRGLATDPLLVRFSGTDVPTWRRAVASCTGTAATVGLVTGACVLVAAGLLDGTTRLAFLALGLTLPGLLLQDSWRFSFFALGRGSQAFINDTIWTVALLPALVLLRETGHATIFWFVFAWGATAAIGAAVGPFQARVIPELHAAWSWVSRNRDLGPRYLIEGTANSGSTQLRNYGVGLVLGLAAVGYVQAANTLMGPVMIVFYGMSLVTLPEAARILRRSPRWLPLFCVLISAGLMAMALAWGVVLLVLLPRGLGHVMLGTLWRPTYPLVVPSIIVTLGACATAGANTGMHALGAAQRSMRTMIIWSALVVGCSLTGALVWGLTATIYGAALASWIGALLYWWQLRVALREYKDASGTIFWPGRGSGRHMRASATDSPLRRRGPDAEQVAGDPADEEPVLGAVNPHLTARDGDADRERQIPDLVGDIGGSRDPGTAGQGLVLDPYLVGANPDPGLAALHEVHVQPFRVVQPKAQLVVVAQRGTRRLHVNRTEVSVIIK
jgi:O-antigen/teichoic acid export membrane protein